LNSLLFSLQYNVKVNYLILVLFHVCVGMKMIFRYRLRYLLSLKFCRGSWI